MNIHEVLAAGQNKIQGGCPYLWACFGGSAHYVLLGPGEGSPRHAAVVFDRDSGIVYALELFDETMGRAWHWVNTLWIEPYLLECNERGVDPDEAYDHVRFEWVDNPQVALALIAELVGDPL